MKVVSILFVSATLAACTEDAREDMHQAGKALERTGHELGEAAHKSAEHIDERAEVVGRELSAELDAAREKLARAKHVADRAGDLYLDPQRQQEIGEEAVRCEAEHYAIDRAMVERAIANPLGVAGSTSFEPVAGKGYRITRVDPGSPVAKLDVREGDILTAVDGTNIDAIDGMSFVDELRRSSEMTFTVERNGEDVRKTVSIEG